MKQITLPRTGLKAPALVVGCMRIDQMSVDQVKQHIVFCLDNGLNFFDHADIYGRGICEEKFGTAVKQLGIKREDYLMQSKCSIIPGVMYDL